MHRGIEGNGLQLGAVPDNATQSYLGTLRSTMRIMSGREGYNSHKATESPFFLYFLFASVPYSFSCLPPRDRPGRDFPPISRPPTPI
jgi:hypothetical protein